MSIESLQRICKTLPAVTEDVKWGNDLCFCIGGKMFCVANLNPPLKVSLKVRDDEFDELCATNGLIPAPYLARYKWILVEKMSCFSRKEWEQYVRQSYELVKARLPKKVLNSLVRRKLL